MDFVVLILSIYTGAAKAAASGANQTLVSFSMQTSMKFIMLINIKCQQLLHFNIYQHDEYIIMELFN